MKTIEEYRVDRWEPLDIELLDCSSVDLLLSQLRLIYPQREYRLIQDGAPEMIEKYRIEEFRVGRWDQLNIALHRQNALVLVRRLRQIYPLRDYRLAVVEPQRQEAAQ